MDEITYFTPPNDNIFEEIKNASMVLWKTYDNKYGYVDEKIGRIRDIKNIKDNAMFMVAMFDHINIAKLKVALSEESVEFIEDRILRGN